MVLPLALACGAFDFALDQARLEQADMFDEDDAVSLDFVADGSKARSIFAADCRRMRLLHFALLW